MKTILLIGLFFLSTLMTFAQTEAILRLDTKGHTARITDIIVTKSGDIISASDDKTIRVWDSKTGEEKRKILGQIGVGVEGQIFAIALSPNEEFLAVGGLLTGKTNSDKSSIRIYNYQSGRLIKVLKSHTNVVVDLAFSSDGKYLISASGDKTAKIWEVKDWVLKDTINFHTNRVYVVKIIKKKGNYFAVTGGYDKKIGLYNINTKRIVKSHKLNYRLNSLAISKKHIAICGIGKEIKVYNYNLEPIKTIKLETKPAGLAYSPNGEFLISGFSSSYKKSTDIINIYSTNQDYKKIQSFQKHTNSTMAVAFLDNQTVISGGGDNSEIYIWNIKTAKVLKKIEGVGDSVWSIGVKGNNLAWGYISNQIHYVNNRAKLQRFINLKTFKMDNLKKINFNKIYTTYKNYQLFPRESKKYGLDKDILDIKRNGEIIASIKRGSTNGYRHNCYGFYKKYIVSGGANGHLEIYNLQGQNIANLVGHTGEVWSIAIDGDRLVSGSSDQTIKIWDLSKLKIKSEKPKINEVVVLLAMKKLNLTREKIIKISKENNINIYLPPKIQKIQPQLSLFITKNNDWIAWTPQGFYNASKGAEKYIGYHINQGANKEAEFLDITRFKKQFYRPDLIQKAINGEDISSYAKGIDINSLLKAGLPPKVSLLDNFIRTDKAEVKLGVKVCPLDGGVVNLTFYIDNKPVKQHKNTKDFTTQKMVNHCTISSQKLSIPSGKHIVSFDATNQEGNIISNQATITVINTQKVKKKPNLHLLTLSINDYQDDALELRFPNNDADELASKLKKIGKPIFEHIYTYSLKDSQVTQREIEKKVAQIAPQIGVEDVFILYISGHGVTNDADGDYYFIPYGCTKGSDVTKNAINQETFKMIMSQINAVKSVILLDTCESGSMASKELVNTSVNRFGGNVGSAIIAGATSKQNAIDGYKEHGIFTYTLLDAMSNNLVYSFDKKLSINEVAEYSKYLLPIIAEEKFNHKQEPTIYLNGDTTFAVGGL